MVEKVITDFKWSSLMTDFSITEKSEDYTYDLEIEFYKIHSEMLDFEPCEISVVKDDEKIKLSGSVYFSLSELAKDLGEEYAADLYRDEASRFIKDLKEHLLESYDGGFVITLSESCISFDANLFKKV